MLTANRKMQCNLYNVYKYNYLCAFIADY